MEPSIDGWQFEMAVVENFFFIARYRWIKYVYKNCLTIVRFHPRKWAFVLHAEFIEIHEIDRNINNSRQSYNENNLAVILCDAKYWHRNNSSNAIQSISFVFISPIVTGLREQHLCFAPLIFFLSHELSLIIIMYSNPWISVHFSSQKLYSLSFLLIRINCKK